MEPSGNTAGEPRTVEASEFAAKCLELVDEVGASGEQIIITKNGRHTARLAPCGPNPKTFFGADRHRMRILGDIVSPVYPDSEEEPSPDSAQPAVSGAGHAGTT